MIKKLLTLFIFSACVISCENPIEHKTTNTIAEKHPLAYLKDSFKFYNLVDFEIDTFNWDNRPGNYKELDSTTFYMVWQGEDRVFSGKGYDRDYLFSWQDRDSNFIEFTILTQDESSYCNILTYFIYNKNGKLIDKFTANASCGDGGWVYYAHGKFIDKNRFQIIETETQMAGFDTLDNSELQEGDSTMFHYTIEDNGTVTKKEVYKRHFITKWDTTID